MASESKKHETGDSTFKATGNDFEMGLPPIKHSKTLVMNVT